jgi:hypothetical protein
MSASLPPRAVTRPTNGSSRQTTAHPNRTRSVFQCYAIVEEGMLQEAGARLIQGGQEQSDAVAWQSSEPGALKYRGVSRQECSVTNRLLYQLSYVGTRIAGYHIWQRSSSPSCEVP